jgi:ketosteroid isomerase-like protein
MIRSLMMVEEHATPDLLELSRRLFAAGGRADVDGLMSFYSPDVVMELPEAGLTFEGLDAIRQFYEDFFGLYEELTSELEELRDMGNGIGLSVIRNHGHPVGSTAEVQQRAAWVSTWREGRITRVTIYVDADEARALAERLAAE